MSDIDNQMAAERQRVLGMLERAEAAGERRKADIIRNTYVDVLAWRPKPAAKPRGMPQDWSVLDNLKGTIE